MPDRSSHQPPLESASRQCQRNAAVTLVSQFPAFFQVGDRIQSPDWDRLEGPLAAPDRSAPDCGVAEVGVMVPHDLGVPKIVPDRVKVLVTANESTSFAPQAHQVRDE